jgi:hypothetical protein
MSAATSLTSSSSAITYATQLAQTSALKRSLTNLGTAIQNGDMVTASTMLAAFIKANPQYTSTSSGATPSQDPISQDFQTLATAISNGQVDAAQTAWTQVKSDLANDGVTNLSDGTPSELIAQNKAAMDQEIMSDLFGASTGGSSSISTLLGGSDGSSSQIGLSSSLLENWQTDQENGTTAPVATTSSSSNLLNTLV